MPTDYSQASIYRIACDDGKFYIGSTVLKLSVRFGQHRRAVENEVNSKVYRHIRALGGAAKARIELVAGDLGIATRDELLRVEDSYIRDAMKSNKALCLNRNRPRATSQERIAREKMQAKMWLKINRDIHRSGASASQKTMGERVREYYRTHKLPRREPRVKSDPEEIVPCECGWDCMRASLAGHKKTKEHRSELMRWSVMKVILAATQ